ncbi:NADH-dependent flavin oxidoreductase [Cadophora sp. DSE1049]|nr:NADH-dependent flavin oxidoreductase [Cadophora sp. DSE1049]
MVGAIPHAHGGLAQHGIPNKAAPDISYFTPAQDPAAGIASDPQPNNRPIPKLFQPLIIRSLVLPNRILLSPLCQYSAQDGHHTAWHFAHLGSIILRGPGLALVEATAVLPEGRITPEDSGIWDDDHLEGEWGLKKIVEFAHSQGQKIGIQLAHAGRKASTVAPWLHRGALATEDAPQPSHTTPITQPIEMTASDIEEVKTAWVAAVHRSVKAGFDVIEIHNAHGYLLHSFLSPASNFRADKYGGSFENRIRLTLEIVELTRKAMPQDMPLFFRVSATDWLDVNPEYEGESWTLEDMLKLAPFLAERGVDFIDVSTAGNHPQQKIALGPGCQAPFAKAIKKAVGSGVLVGTVGMITTGKQAEALLTGIGEEEDTRGSQELDAIAVGRMFQKNPGLVWSWAEELGVEINIASQIRWGFGGRPGAPKK